MSDESPDLDDDLILQRLEWSVRALAQPAAVQRTLFPDVVGAGEELALEFDQWFREIRDSLGISDVGCRCLDRLDEQLTRMTAQDDENLWFDDDTLARSADWATIRALAQRTLIAMGWSSEPPPAERDTYVAAPSKPDEPTALVDVVRAYAALQSRLVADLLAAHPAVVTEGNPQRWPRNGVLHSGGADWHSAATASATACATSATAPSSRRTIGSRQRPTPSTPCGSASTSSRAASASATAARACRSSTTPSPPPSPISRVTACSSTTLPWRRAPARRTGWHSKPARAPRARLRQARRLGARSRAAPARPRRVHHHLRAR
jgi:hypothetical protein